MRSAPPDHAESYRKYPEAHSNVVRFWLGPVFFLGTIICYPKRVVRTCFLLRDYPPTPAGAAPRSSVHVCSPLSTTRPLPFLQIAIGPPLPHPFYCSGISPPPPGTTRHSSALLGTTNRPRLLHPVYFSGIAMVVE